MLILSIILLFLIFLKIFESRLPSAIHFILFSLSLKIFNIFPLNWAGNSGICLLGMSIVLFDKSPEK